jgi:hypothetical protein
MGWQIGYDSNWDRDIGYGVPSICDHPDCGEEIDRGLSYVCGGEPYGGQHGCGLFFCEAHLLHGDPIDPDANLEDYDEADARAWTASLMSTPSVYCQPCLDATAPFKPKPDVPQWTHFKATDPSWAEWRKEQV